MKTFIQAPFVAGVVATFVLICGGCASRLNQEIHRIEKKLTGGDRVVVSGYYRKGELVEHGRCVYYVSNGIRCEINYEHGAAEGKCKWYYPDGSVAFEGSYRKNRPWNGIAMTLRMCNGPPHKYWFGIDCGEWKDPRGMFNEE